MAYTHDTANEFLGTVAVFVEDFRNAGVHGRAVAQLAEKFLRDAEALMSADISVCHPERDTFSPLCAELGINPWAQS